MDEPATVLIVDDEEGILKLLEALLTQAGHNVVLAENGDKAVEAVKEGDVHVALVDKNLPDIDGVELVGKLSETQPELVAAIMTGYGSLRSSLDALEVGVARYILKPFDDIALINRTVWDILNERETRIKRRRSLTESEDEEAADEGPPVRVIVADSSDDDRDELKDALSGVGCEVKEATCAQEALLYLTGDPFEALVVAFDMGDMTADDVLLRAKRISSDVAVVVTSAAPTLDMTTSLIRRGAAGFVEKPLKDPKRTAESILRQGHAARHRMEEKD